MKENDGAARPATWSDLASIFMLLARAFYAEWKPDLPKDGNTPAPAIDAACDGWCRTLAGNMAAPIRPPEELRPWIVVRVLSAAALASQLAKQGDTDCPPATPETMRRLLIDEWYGALRQRWPDVCHPE